MPAVSEQLRLFEPDARPLGIVSATNEAAQPLTLEDLQAAFDAIANQPYEPHPCKLGRHLVSARTKRHLINGGTARCVECWTVLGPYN